MISDDLKKYATRARLSGMIVVADATGTLFLVGTDWARRQSWYATSEHLGYGPTDGADGLHDLPDGTYTRVLDGKKIILGQEVPAAPVPKTRTVQHNTEGRQVPVTITTTPALVDFLKAEVGDYVYTPEAGGFWVGNQIRWSVNGVSVLVPIGTPTLLRDRAFAVAAKAQHGSMVAAFTPIDRTAWNYTIDLGPERLYVIRGWGQSPTTYITAVPDTLSAAIIIRALPDHGRVVNPDFGVFARMVGSITEVHYP